MRIKVRIGLIAIALVTVLLPVMAVQANVVLPQVQAENASPTWYDTDYDYRQQFTVIGSETPLSYLTGAVSDFTGACNYMNPHAVYSGGYSYFPYVASGGADNLKLKIFTFNHSSKTFSSTVVVDTTNSADICRPTINIDDSGYIHIMWCTNGDAALGVTHHRVSVNPNDISAWEDGNAPSDSANAAEPNLLKDSSGNLYYISQARIDNTHRVIRIRKSADDGVTWTNPLGGSTELVDFGANTFVWPSYCWMDANDKIHILWEKATGGQEDLHHVFYVCGETGGTVWKKADGDTLTPAITEATADKVYNSSTTSVETRGAHLRLNSSGYPYILMARRGVTYMEGYFAKWTGAAWETYALGVNSGNTQESWGRLEITDDDNLVVYYERDSPDDILIYKSSNAGETWSYDQTFYDAVTSAWAVAEVIGNTGGIKYFWNDGGDMAAYGTDWPTGTGTELTNYPKKFTVYKGAGSSTDTDIYLGGHCNDDFSDLRFTTFAGSGLDYWVESYTSGTSAVVWVEFDSIPANPSSADFFIYYGNAGASTASSGVNTFEFFDDFDSYNTATNWTTKAGTPEASGGVLQLLMAGGTQERMSSQETWGVGYAVRSRLKTKHFNNTSYRENLGIQATNTDLSAAYSSPSNSPSIVGKYYVYASSWGTPQSITGWVADTYAIQDIIRNGSTSLIFKVNDSNTVTFIDHLATATSTYIDIWAGTANDSEVDVDWILVRQYATNEPTVSDWVAEEAYNPGAPTMTTHEATSVTGDEATLNGEIADTGDAEVDVRGFVWDTSSHADPGDTAPAASDYSDNWTESGSYAEGTFNHGISSLTISTLYYVRAVGHNTIGYAYGDEVMFLTSPDAPNSIALTVSSTQIVVTWVKGSGADTTLVRYKDGSYPSSTSDGTQAYNGAGTTTTIGSLTDGHTYYIRIWSVATDGGLTKYSDTYDEDNGTPVAPYLLTITRLKVNPSNTAMTISWTIPTGAVSSVVRYSTTTFPATIADGTLAYSGTSFHTKVTGLTPGTTYYISAWAFDGATYSATPATVVTTLHAVAILSGGEPDQPSDIVSFPAFQAPQAPDTTGFQLEPISTILAYFQSAPGGLNMPVANLWETGFIIGLVALGGFLYVKTKNFFVAMIAVMVLTWVGADRELCQWELLYIEATLAVAVFAVERVFS